MHHRGTFLVVCANNRKIIALSAVKSRCLYVRVKTKFRFNSENENIIAWRECASSPHCSVVFDFHFASNWCAAGFLCKHRHWNRSAVAFAIAIAIVYIREHFLHGIHLQIEIIARIMCVLAYKLLYFNLWFDALFVVQWDNASPNA